MAVLIASLVAIAAGPIFFELVGRRRGVLEALDAFVVVAVGGLVLLHLLPHGVATAGWWAGAAAVIGIVLPTLAHKHLHREDGAPSSLILGLALAGLAVHALLDGTALSASGLHDHHVHVMGEHEARGDLMALGVVLHRLPLGLALWWLVRPAVGRGWALAALLVIVAATVTGFAAGRPLLTHLPVEGLAIFEALIAGSLFHVVLHHPIRLHAGAPPRFVTGIGGALGLSLLVGLSLSHPIAEHGTLSLGFVKAFVALALETAPALLIAFVGASLLTAFSGNGRLKWLGRGSSMGQVTRGTAFGLPLPVCSCGVVPLYETLIKGGVPATAGLAFLIATPELGIDAVLISIPLLGAELTVTRILAAIAVTMVVAGFVGTWIERRRTGPPVADTAAVDTAEPMPLGERLKRGFQFGFIELVDHTMPWILLGVVLAALLEPMLAYAVLDGLPFGLDVLLAALVGMPLYICATGATPLVAVLLHKGLSPGAAIALLLTGPATNITTFGLLRKLHGAPAAVRFAVTMTIMAVTAGVITNLALPDAGLNVPPLQDVSEHGADPLQLACLIVIGLITGWSLLRRGPRELIAEMSPTTGEGHDHDHGHGHGHGHAHGHGHHH